MRGDHRNKIVEFLIEEGIGTKENIVKHGGDMWTYHWIFDKLYL